MVNQKQPKNCQQIDGKGQYILPGLIDSHGHVSGLGNEMLRVMLRGVKSEKAAAQTSKRIRR